jgi:hypothetical protein
VDRENVRGDLIGGGVDWEKPSMAGKTVAQLAAGRRFRRERTELSFTKRIRL